jgi:hypothetical protein
MQIFKAVAKFLRIKIDATRLQFQGSLNVNLETRLSAFYERVGLEMVKVRACILHKYSTKSRIRTAKHDRPGRVQCGAKFRTCIFQNFPLNKLDSTLSADQPQYFSGCYLQYVIRVRIGPRLRLVVVVLLWKWARYVTGHPIRT